MASRNQDWLDEISDEGLPALGFLELSSISRGLYLTDAVLKKAPVKVIASQPISSGKHIVLYFGQVAAVEESHKEAVSRAEGCLLRQVLIHGIHPGLVPFLDSLWDQGGTAGTTGESVAIVESRSLAGAILSADRALKAADVSLCRMRLGRGIGGKAYFVLCGRQEEIEAAVEAADTCLKDLESLVRSDIIPRPIEEALIHF